MGVKMTSKPNFNSSKKKLIYQNFCKNENLNYFVHEIIAKINLINSRTFFYILIMIIFFKTFMLNLYHKYK